MLHQVIVDTGVLVALIDRRDRFGPRSSQFEALTSLICLLAFEPLSELFD